MKNNDEKQWWNRRYQLCWAYVPEPLEMSQPVDGLTSAYIDKMATNHCWRVILKTEVSDAPGGLHCVQYQQTPSDPAEDLRRSIMGTAHLYLFLIL